MRHLVLFENFKSIPKSIKDRLEGVIRDFRVRLRGGRDFFNAMDAYIKDPSNIDIILELVSKHENDLISTSGEFGDILYKLWIENKFKCKGMIVFNGKMQTNNIGISSYYPNEFDLNNKKFVYIDDSYFSGSTVTKVKEFLKKHNSNIKSVSVIYDGSKEINDNVNSFIRYYDIKDLPSWNSNT